ncbi:MAG: hypothetical protein GQ537_06290 [Gammaproteobacteria bacterium]|jgi:hypothetical protein|nr:hypothetical protein [Gammaproteobacteria bacterium]
MLKPAPHFLSLLFIALLVSSSARADDIADAALGLCEKVKSCAMAQIAKEDLTPEMRQMMQPMLDNMCANMQGKVEAVPSGHAMYAPAVACMRSMEALSCEAMQGEQVRTPECKTYEKLARETYGDS